jgi:hypothetical protein
MIATDSWWIKDTPEKMQADKISKLVAEIRNGDREQISQSNSQTILDKFAQLRKAGAQISDHNNILVRHKKYLRYHILMAKAEKKGKSLIERLKNAKKAVEIVSIDTSLSNRYPNKAQNLVADLELEQELLTISKQLKTVQPSKLDLTQIRKYWYRSVFLKSAVARLAQNDRSVLDVLRLYDECNHQKNLPSCEKLANTKSNKLGKWNIKPFKKDAKTILAERATQIANEESKLNDTTTVVEITPNTKKDTDLSDNLFDKMLDSNHKLDKYYAALYKDKQRYPYFGVGVDVWTGKTSYNNYYTLDKYLLAKAIKFLILKDGDQLQAGMKFKELTDKIKIVFPNEPITKRGSKLNKAYFVRAIFIGLSHIKRQQYSNSYAVIYRAFKKYKYTRDMNCFSKALLDAISSHGNLGKPEVVLKTPCR